MEEGATVGDGVVERAAEEEAAAAELRKLDSEEGKGVAVAAGDCVSEGVEYPGGAGPIRGDDNVGYRDLRGNSVDELGSGVVAADEHVERDGRL